MKKIDDRKREELEKIILKKTESKYDSRHAMRAHKKSKTIAVFM
jgi:hypothetical protein